MKKISIRMASSALAVGIALATLPSPGFAQRSEMPISAARQKALLDCNALAERSHSNYSGTRMLQPYRACMAEHGEQE
jgi:hypothetical protein